MSDIKTKIILDEAFVNGKLHKNAEVIAEDLYAVTVVEDTPSPDSEDDIVSLYFQDSPKPIIVRGFGPSALTPFRQVASDVTVTSTCWVPRTGGSDLVRKTAKFPLGLYSTFEK